MKSLLIVSLLVVAVVVISGCTSDSPVGGLYVNNGCEPDYIAGGPLQKIGGMESNFTATCGNMCSDKYKINSFRIDEKTDSFSMCYCDVNVC